MKRKIFSLMVAVVLVLTAVPAMANETEGEVVHWKNLGMNETEALNDNDGWIMSADSTGTAEIQSETKAEGAGALKIVNAEGQTTKVTQKITLPDSFRGHRFSVRAELKVMSATGNGARLEVRKSDGNLSSYSTSESAKWEAQTNYITTTDEKFILLDIAPYKHGSYIINLILDGAGEVYFDNVQIQEIFGYSNIGFDGYRGYSDATKTVGGSWTTEGGTAIIQTDDVQGNYVYLTTTSDYLKSTYMTPLEAEKIYRLSWKYKSVGGYNIQVSVIQKGQQSDRYAINATPTTFDGFGKASPSSGKDWGVGEYIFTMPEGYWGVKVQFRGRGGGLSLDDFVLEEVPETNISFAEGENDATNVTAAVASKVADEKPFILLCRYGKNGTARVLKDVKVVSPTITSSFVLGTIPVAYLGSKTESFTTDAGDTIEVMRWNSASGLSPMMDKIVR